MKKMVLAVLGVAVVVAWSSPVKAVDQYAAAKSDKAVEKKSEGKQAEKPAPKVSDSKPAAPATNGNGFKQVTQGELAQLLVNVLGLTRFLPANATEQHYFSILMANNIVPAGGWIGSAVVNKADLARVIVQAMKKQNEVANPDDPKSWVDYLKSIGVPIDTIGEAVDYVEPLPEPVAPGALMANSDPLVRRQKGNPTDETQYGTDMANLVRIFSQLEFDSGEFRPVPITQD